MLLRQHSQTLSLQLKRDLSRVIRRGHPWVYADALRETPSAAPGTPALLLDHKHGRPLARGFYTPDSPLALRLCHTHPNQALDETWAVQQVQRAITLRRTLFAGQETTTTAFRLLNGEGDGLPGLVCDVYADTAVLVLDGAGAAGFWNAAGLAEYLAAEMKLTHVYERYRHRGGPSGQALFGPPPPEQVHFLENGIWFAADVMQGQKTGFFLDQRDNRYRIGQLAAGRRVLNVFGYSGGFSVYSGLAGAHHVTTLDQAKPALAQAETNWQLNQLDSRYHQTIAADAFAYLAEQATRQQRWELVILDPPSLAPSKKSVPRAKQAYQRLIAAGAAITTNNGILAAASCSSHINNEAFLSLCEEGVSQAGRQAQVLGIYGPPADHPSPLAGGEFRYLKFVLLQLD